MARRKLYLRQTPQARQPDNSGRSGVYCLTDKRYPTARQRRPAPNPEAIVRSQHPCQRAKDQSQDQSLRGTRWHDNKTLRHCVASLATSITSLDVTKSSRACRGGQIWAAGVTMDPRSLSYEPDYYSAAIQPTIHMSISEKTQASRQVSYYTHGVDTCSCSWETSTTKLQLLLGFKSHEPSHPFVSALPSLLNPKERS